MTDITKTFPNAWLLNTGAQCSVQRMKMQADHVKWHLLDLVWACVMVRHFTSLLVIISVTLTDTQLLRQSYLLNFTFKNRLHKHHLATKITYTVQQEGSQPDFQCLGCAIRAVSLMNLLNLVNRTQR